MDQLEIGGAEEITVKTDIWTGYMKLWLNFFLKKKNVLF